MLNDKLHELFFRTYAAMLTLGRDEEGASAVEYGLILGLIAVAVIIVLGLLGTKLNGLFTKVKDALPT